MFRGTPGLNLLPGHILTNATYYPMHQKVPVVTRDQALCRLFCLFRLFAGLSRQESNSSRRRDGLYTPAMKRYWTTLHDNRHVK